MYVLFPLSINKHCSYMQTFTVALQRNILVKGRCMLTMMVLLCYVNLSGMSLECIVIVLMNNSLLGGQFCTDNVDCDNVVLLVTQE